MDWNGKDPDTVKVHLVKLRVLTRTFLFHINYRLRLPHIDQFNDRNLHLKRLSS
jgi:hypothetical protein